MAVLGCDVEELLALSACFECLSENQLLQIEVRLREQFYADGAGSSPRGIKELLVAAQRWTSLSEHQKQAIEVRELCNDAVIVGARANCDTDELKNESACYCTSSSNLKAIVSYLKCLQRQT